VTTLATDKTVGTASSASVRRRRRRKHRTGSNILAIVVSVIWIFPVYWMVLTSFKQPWNVLNATPEFLPKNPSLQNYVNALTQTSFFTNLKNSVIVVALTLVFAIILAMFASAALTRFRFRGRRVILVIILAVQMLPGTALLIPQFLVFNRMGLLNHYAGLILAYVALTLPFSIWVMRGFFLAIPKEVEEAAEVDGANTWTVMWRVLFPLVAPGVIASSVFSFIAAWNDYLVAYVFMKDQTMYTLPVWLASFAVPNQPIDYAAQMAASVIFSLPAVIFFLIIQRNLVTGMSAGAVKG